MGVQNSVRSIHDHKDGFDILVHAAGGLAVALGEYRGGDLVCSGCREAIHGQFVELSVSDTGPGIDQAIIERIFEPFFTTKDIGKGSGMGLSTVHGIVHDHEGHALVNSTLGQGTTMRVLLPISVATATDEAQVTQAEPRVDGETFSGHVLIVDDNIEVGEYLEALRSQLDRLV